MPENHESNGSTVKDLQPYKIYKAVRFF